MLLCRLRVPLHYRHAGNLACVKLINQENLMDEHDDQHPSPNIDINFVAFRGRMVKLAGTASAAAAANMQQSHTSSGPM